MPRTFTLQTSYQAPIERVYAAMTNRDYWLARLEDSGASDVSLDQLITHPDGIISIQTRQTIKSNKLPALISKVHSGDLVIHRTEDWPPLVQHQTRAELTGVIMDAPAQARGHALMYTEQSCTNVDFSISVQVGIPLIGGKIETFMGERLLALMKAEQEFTTRWLASDVL